MWFYEHQNQSGLDRSRYSSQHCCLGMAVRTHSTISWSNLQLQVVFATDDAFPKLWTENYLSSLRVCHTEMGWNSPLARVTHNRGFCVHSTRGEFAILNDTPGVFHPKSERQKQELATAEVKTFTEVLGFPTCESLFFLSGARVSHTLFFFPLSAVPAVSSHAVRVWPGACVW